MTHHITADRLVESALMPSRKSCSATSITHSAPSAMRKPTAKPFFALCVMRVSACAYYTDISRKRKRRRVVLKFGWTGAVVELVELIYALHEMKRIDDGEIAMNELAGFFGELFGIRLDARSLYDAYTDIKRRKGESRTYFLDKSRERLNLRMQRDDEKEQERRR